MTRPHLPTLAGGIAVLVLGIVLLLERTGGMDLGIGAVAPIVLAATGVVLLASGVSARS